MPLLAGLVVFAQNPSGRWLVYEGSDGARLVVTLAENGSGKAELSLTRRFEAVSYGEGSQFWGTFRTMGGYYFLVHGVKSESISVVQSDSTWTITRLEEPVTQVSARLDEAYSTRELSDYGDYKEQVLPQWRWDFLNNEDVEKGKWIMEHYFHDFYGEVFEVLLEGRFRMTEQSDSTWVLQNLKLDLPQLTWKRLD
jgi:hypothetical protein